MIKNVALFPHGAHRDVQACLPWYVTGQLEAADWARVEAHLEGCAQCREDLKAERALAACVAELPAASGRSVDQGWTSLRRNLERRNTATRPRAASWLQGVASWMKESMNVRLSSPWLGPAMLAQACVFMAVGAVVSHRAAPPPRLYQTLSAPPVARVANVVVLFRPETTERSLQELLEASHARFVDGPTVSGAYLLEVPAAALDPTVDRIRRSADVVLVQPIDAGAR